jgi:KaiC/GvpD/RAD55 family RecA-like ATPase
MKYVRLCSGVRDRGILIPPSEVHDRVSSDTDWYQSVYNYNDSHMTKFTETGSVRGIKDVTTNFLVFDFDNKQDPEFARQDALKLIDRLLKTELNIRTEDIQIYFSGNKGYNVVLELDKELTPDSAASLATKYAGDLKSFDVSLYDASQILRVPGTRHQKSGLFKIPLTYSQLLNSSSGEIAVMAASLDNVGSFEWGVASPSIAFYDVYKAPEKLQVTPVDTEIDWSKKPANWKNCKYAILQGHFDSGVRHNALMVLAATCRGFSYDKELTYYTCKSALKKQAARTGQDEFDKSELWINIIEESVFADGWEGGQYSCKSDPWLKRYCEGLGEHRCKEQEEEKDCVDFDLMSGKFTDYAQNFEKNVIKTGIKGLDDNVMLCVSTLNGLLGQPGAGKTSMSLNYLRNASLTDTKSVFFSLDMGLPIVYAKLVQKMTGYNFKKALNVYKSNPMEAVELDKKIREEYKNVSFNFRSGLTVSDMKKVIQDREQQLGDKIKLVVIDYLECIAGPYSDATANSGFICNQLKDLANESNVCILLLLQTQKHSTAEISDPLLSLKQVKGSSLIEQSCSTITTLWREGYSPDTVNDDRFISFSVVKNRFGSLWRGDFGWDGVTGDIRGLAEEEKIILKEFRRQKEERKMMKDKEWE